METTYCLVLRDAGPKACRTAVEAAHVLGFLSVSMQFPVLREEGHIPDGCTPVFIGSDTDWPALRRELLSAAESPRLNQPPEGYVSALTHKPLPAPSPDRGGLERMFDRLIEDTDNDGLPDTVRVRLLLNAGMDRHACSAACDLAARFGLDSCGIPDAFTVLSDDGETPLLRLTGRGAPAVRLAQTSPRTVIDIDGSGPELAAFVSDFCERFPCVGPLFDVGDALAQLARALSVGNCDGQLARASLHAEETPLLFADGDPQRFRTLYPEREWHRYADDAAPLVLDCALPDETEAFLRQADALCALAKPGDHVRVRAALWKDRPAREALAKGLTERLCGLGTSPDVKILCAYKQPVSWLEEDFTPRAAALGKVARLVLRYAVRLPGQPEGEMKPPRTLMDLYPGDRLAAQVLSIGEGAVTVEPMTEDNGPAYEALAYDADGALLLRDSYTVMAEVEPYLADYPEAGQSFQPQGYFSAELNGCSVCACRIMTAADAVREAFEKQVLPWLRTQLGDERRLPLFSHLDLDITAGGPDRQLEGCDLLSAGEALDEYLTMAMNTWTRFYTMERFGSPVSGIGRLVPRLHMREGAPSMRALLYRCRGYAPAPVFAVPEVRCVAVRPGLMLDAEAIGADPDQLTALLRLTEAGHTDLPERLKGYAALTVNGVTAHLPHPDPLPPLSADDIDWHEDRLVGWSDYDRLMEQLSRVPELTVFRAGHSFQGRVIRAVMPRERRSGYVSRSKLILTRPTLIVNGRHHANEISSSNAILGLIRRCVTDPPEGVNLIMLPMENPDSAARHEELQREHPHWQFHSCYENALNDDLIPNYFHEDTLCTEALAFTRLAERWQPDAFADLHGVPHHEMPQQFAALRGYKGLWIPRAMLYGFYFHVDDPRFASNKACNLAWSHAVNRAYRDWDRFRDTNVRLEKRFQKYAWNGADESFPFRWEGGFLNYWPASPQNDRHPYLSISRPWLLSVLFTAEAADETASGEWLSLCREAHLRHLNASVGMLERCRLAVSREELNGGLHLTRHRPLLPDKEDLNDA